MEGLVETLVLLVAVKNESEHVEQIKRLRSSQPCMISSATEPATESPSALSLLEVKSKALESVRLRSFSEGDPIEDPSEDPIPESTGEEARRFALAKRLSSES